MQETRVILSSVAFFINTALGILFAGAVLMVFWGFIRYSFKKKNDQERTRLSDFMLRGVIWGVIIIAAWGFSTILFWIFGVTPTLPP